MWSPDGSKVLFRRQTAVLSISSTGRRARTLVRRGAVTWLPTGKLGVSSYPGVYLMNPDGSGRRRITVGELPVWSPNARKVVVSRYFQARNTTKLVIVDVRTRAERVVPRPRCRCSWTDESPVWSPDSRHFLFTRFVAAGGGQTYELDLVDAGATRLQRVATREMEAVTWSPLGNLAAGTSWDEIGRVLWVISLDGRSTRIGRGATPSWSPSGDLLAYRGADGAYVSRPDGTALRRLVGPSGPTCPPEVSPCSAPQWSRDGDHILWASGTAIVVSRADGEGGRTVAEGVGAAWSPGNDRIAFSTLRCGEDQGVYIVRTDGSNLVRLSRHCSIYGTYLRERILGTPADDTIYARDRKKDRIKCLSGSDRVIADRVDLVSECEVVRRR
jgi:Tol biopolymer transport system component